MAVDERKSSETDSKSGITEIMGKKSKEGVAMSFTASIFHESCKCIYIEFITNMTDHLHNKCNKDY